MAVVEGEVNTEGRLLDMGGEAGVLAVWRVELELGSAAVEAVCFTLSRLYIGCEDSSLHVVTR